MSTQKVVSVRQLQMLVEFMKTHKDLALGRVRSKEGRAKSAKLWTQIANKLNPEVGVKYYRSPKEWNRFYNDYKCRVRTKARKIKAEEAAGEHIDVTLTPIEAMLCEIITTEKPEPVAVQYIEEVQIDGYKCEPNDELDLEQSSIFEAEQTIEEGPTMDKLRTPPAKVQRVTESQSQIHQREEIDSDNNTKSFVQATLEMETKKIKVDRERNAIEMQKTEALNNIASALWAISKSLNKRRRNSGESSEEE